MGSIGSGFLALPTHIIVPRQLSARYHGGSAHGYKLEPTMTRAKNGNDFIAPGSHRSSHFLLGTINHGVSMVIQLLAGLRSTRVPTVRILLRVNGKYRVQRATLHADVPVKLDTIPLTQWTTPSSPPKFTFATRTYTPKCKE